MDNDNNQPARPGSHVTGPYGGKVGPTSIEGVEASDLPDGGRGPVETDFGKEAARDLPEQVGGVIGEESGLRSRPEAVQSDARGGRKHN
jgi:hypothetical protein